MSRRDFIIKKLDEIFRSYHRKFDHENADMWVKALSWFEPHVFDTAADKWCAKQPKPPFLSQLVEACNNLKNYIERETPPSVADTICRYHSQCESQWSRQLCSEVKPEELQACRVQGWDPLCSWHYACTYAKIYPDSTTAAMVKATLRARKQSAESPLAENEFFLRTLGFNPFDKDPAKKDNAAEIREAMARVANNGGQETAPSVEIIPDISAANTSVTLNAQVAL